MAMDLVDFVSCQINWYLVPIFCNKKKALLVVNCSLLCFSLCHESNKFHYSNSGTSYFNCYRHVKVYVADLRELILADRLTYNPIKCVDVLTSTSMYFLWTSRISL